LVVEKDPFQFWNDNAKLIFQQEEVRIYDIDDDEYLFVGQIMYASTSERRWYLHNVYPHAKGKCLEIGLGLGIASRVILLSKKVSHLLTVEKNENVIAALGQPFPRHNILSADVYEWAKNLYLLEPTYDLIFVDHYTFESEDFEELEELQAVLKPVLKKGGRMIWWIDENAPDEDQEQVKNLWI
jgi:spermidine synthase